MPAGAGGTAVLWFAEPMMVQIGRHPKAAVEVGLDTKQAASEPLKTSPKPEVLEMRKEFAFIPTLPTPL